MWCAPRPSVPCIRRVPAAYHIVSIRSNILIEVFLAYLETRTSSQRTAQLHHSTADFISHRYFAAVMLDWGASGGVIVICATVLTTAHDAGAWRATRCRCGGVCGGCGFWSTSETGEETWATGGGCASHFDLE
jgi:hypothetical protein